MSTAASDLVSCPGEPGKVAPVVDRNRCEAKGDCVRVCPYNVFEIRTLAPDDRQRLSWRGKLKAWVHGNRQSFVARPDACHARKLCIDACPEQALSLAPNLRH
ncbi:MAG: ferredoxin family protein [Betaproteobacteria bacterium]|nr:ferredoxin family protein [Betaproteobacteria bacterium]